jgi:hypothetical protein
MKKSNYTVQIIEPNEGFTLTQSAEVDVKSRIFSKKIYLAVNDSPDNWKEITDAEAEELQAEQERLFKEEEENNIPNE